MNTVCSSCHIKIDDFLKKIDLLLTFGEEVNEIHGTIIENPPTESTDRDIFSGDNLQDLDGSRVHDGFRVQRNTIDWAEINSRMIGDARTRELAKINVEGNGSFDSADTRSVGIGIGNSEAKVTSERNRNHAGRAKRKKRQLTCDFCQKEFHHAGDLNKHRRTHTGEQPYVCDECEQRFSYACNLARHRRVHSGERPFSCRTCGRTFTRKDKLSAHLTAKRCIAKH